MDIHSTAKLKQYECGRFWKCKTNIHTNVETNLIIKKIKEFILICKTGLKKHP